MDYLVIMRITDPTDPEVQRRRDEARGAHIENARSMKQKGHLLMGGVIFDEAGNPAGTASVARFETRDALEEWLRNDPYTLARVWETFEIIPYEIAPHYLAQQKQ